MNLRPDQVPQEEISTSTVVERKNEEGTGVKIHREYRVEWSSVLNEKDTIEVVENETRHKTHKNWAGDTENHRDSFTISESEVVERVDEKEKTAETRREWLTKLAIEEIIEDRKQI